MDPSHQIGSPGGSTGQPSGAWTRACRLTHDSPSFFEPEEPLMVVQAYILIQTDVGKAAEVAAAIAQVKGVTLAEDVTGPYDVIVRAEARNVDELGKLVVSKVQNLEGITRTLTCPVVHI
jgi:DNA-binding Lrp family transcriptional regulator